jgi:hypothetical protein
LAIRHPDSRLMVEAEYGYRDDGALPPRPSGQKQYEPLPYCYVGAGDLRLDSDATRDRLLKGILRKQRYCDRFVPWREGASPQEHFEAEIREEQRKWQERRDREDKDWREKQATEDKEWRKKQAEVESHRHIIQLIVFGVLVTAISATVQIVAALIEREILL